MKATTVLTLLLLVAAYTIWRIARQIMATYGHLEEEILQEYDEGTLRRDNPRLYRRVVVHLDACAKCRALLEEIRHGKPIEDHLVE